MLADHIEFIGEVKNIVSSKHNGKIINLMVAGSHLFGFESSDSDTDYRGYFQTVTNRLLTTRILDDNMQYKIVKDGMTTNDIHNKDIYDKDVDLDELGKGVSLLLAGNCNHYEHLFADYLLTSPEHMELKKIFSGQMNLNGLYKSYRGMAYQNYKKFIIGGKHTVKKYLYVLRGLMAGCWLLNEGSIQPNIGILADEYDSPITKELIDLKKRGMEKDRVNKNLDKYNKEVDYWFEYIDTLAKDLPELNNKIREERRCVLDGWLMKTRLGYIDGY